MHGRFRRGLTAAILCSILAGCPRADAPAPEAGHTQAWVGTEIVSSDYQPADGFGLSLAMSGDGTMVVVGAIGKAIGGNQGRGKVYVFRWNGAAWGETSITASDGAAEDYFGYSLAVSSNGNTVAVGTWGKAVGSNAHQGKAYVYTWNGSGWSETGITSSDGEAEDYFGSSVALSSDGEALAVGASKKCIGGNPTPQGKAYLYAWDGYVWVETGIAASDGMPEDGFGLPVALSSDGKTLAVGATGKDFGINQGQGKVYVYTLNGSSWAETGIMASDGAGFDWFGSSLALSANGKVLAVGAPGKYVGLVPAMGTEYVFTLDGGAWTGMSVIPSDGMLQDYFGSSTALSSDGKTLVVGSPHKTIGAKQSQGEAYVCTSNGTAWAGTGLLASDGAASDGFGSCVAVSSDGKTLAVGSRRIYLERWR
jgi:hypothetical protein